MDIPETGAVFTLGKSYLSENHQSYFFIKNDPIKKLITGSHQSAVICESGRLFVWGENQFGQLATGTTDIVTKPSCVKVIKNLGYKVRTIAFGEAFSVILTENSKVFFNGKSIFASNETFGTKLWHLGNGEFITRQNLEIVDFQQQCVDADGNLDDLVDVVAGGTHFVVLTNSGKLFCYGLFDFSKIKKQKKPLGPRQISERQTVRVAKCGTTFTTFVNDRNETFLIGRFNGVDYPKLTKLNTTAVKDSIYTLYVSQDDEIFLISGSGDVYKSANEGDIHFERIILFNDNAVVRKFSSGNGFVCVLTDKNKLVTTFNEKTSAKRNVSIAPRELRKFHDLHILDVATGVEHILLFAISKSNIYTSLDISSSDPNENIPVKGTPVKVRKTSVSGPTAPAPRKNSKSSAEIAPKEIAPDTRAPILTKQTLESIYTDTLGSEKKPEPKLEQKSVPKKESKVEPTLEVQREAKPEPKTIQKQESIVKPPLAPQPESKPSQPEDAVKSGDSRKSSVDKESQEALVESASLKEFEKLEMENTIGTAVANVGDSIKTDVMSMMATGKQQMNEVKIEVVKTVTEIPQHMTEFTKTTIVPKIDDQIKHVAETKNEILDGIFDEVKQSKQFLKQSIAKKLSIDGGDAAKPDDSGETGVRQVDKTKEFLNENMNEMEQMLRSDRIKQEMEKDEKIEVLVDAAPPNANATVDEHVKFIDNGVDVSKTSDIIQSMKEEIKEMDAGAEDQVMEIKENFDSKMTVLGEKMGASKEAFVDTMTKTKNDSKEAIATVTNSVPYKIIPLKYDLEEVDLEGDGDTERTTASIKSANTPTKNPFDGDDVDDMVPKKEDIPPAKESGGEGRVKRFLNDIKSNCKTADTVVEMEHSAEQFVKSHSIDDVIGDNKTSKVCTIL